MTAGDPLLAIDGLTFRYRRASEPAIRDISLSIGRGEILLVAGPSGCGKSTLIRSINGLIPHAYPGELSGTVRIDGRSTADTKLRDLARTVGTVLQDPAKQIIGATVDAELAFGPENLGIEQSEIAARIDAVIEQTGTTHLKGRDTSALSGGERQLVAVAGSLMLHPQLLVVDEPLANLDPETAAHLLGILRDLAQAGNAIVLVEHRVEEALEARPDRVLYLEEGRTRYLGPVDGFLEIADPDAVKLPFEVVLARARAEGAGSPAPGSPAPESPVPAAPIDASADASADAAPAEPARLAYEGVNASLGDRRILHGISARLGPREIVAVLGPNGAGKTTLFRAAMGLLPVTEGTVLVDGRPIVGRSVAELASIFGYVFQSPSQMLFARTVREELLFGPRNLKSDPASFDDLLDEVLRRTSLVDLENILDRPPLTLSFGQQKRLALAIALALRPKTLILDEPSSGQDHRTSTAFLAAVRRIEGIESLYLITHDVDLALTHADRILLLRDGTVVADGPPNTVIEDEDRWKSCNLRPTSLMRANAHWRAGEAGFLDAASLARSIVTKERPIREQVEGRGG